ncbi:uncharacterized protein LOC141915448 isoform X2 [Tubulanus polymorphus]|uniref:uncharacterized protein LOC141915448 isoform X2 n=1 Tax=Tubulanus polymorphus TaxID=672921 RepID=UPI003DA55B17
MALPLVGDSGGFRNAYAKRQSQLERWSESETNKQPVTLKHDLGKVRFPEDCIFLAACAQFDKKEIERLLEKGANINTGNIDGLTALHQACIDGKLDMVKFLAERGADLDVCDNEGWTPLHATASCGFLDIAKYLLDNGANIAAVNNDGELAVDIAEEDDMQEFLEQEMGLRGLDADAARREEEEMMLNDANNWLKTKVIRETHHPKTGATAFHVAAAKGYIKVLNLLLQMDNRDIDIKDNDGWTPLHAASHWGQEESCRVLAENFCNMDIRNKWGQTAFDVAAPELVELLKELQEKQVTLRRDHLEHQVINRVQLPVKRKSSVTRLSNDQKQNLVLKNVEEERAKLEAIRSTEKENDEVSTSSTSSESESDTERNNVINRNASVHTAIENNKHTPSIAQPKNELSANAAETPRIQDLAKEPNKPMDVKDRVTERLKERQRERQREREKAQELEREKELNIDRKQKELLFANEKEIELEKEREKQLKLETELAEAAEKEKKRIEEQKEREKEQEKLEKEKVSVPASKPNENEGPRTWRLGLRKTSSTHQVSNLSRDDKINKEKPGLFRSYSSPFLAENDKERKSSQDTELANRERRRFIAPNAFVLSSSSSSLSSSTVPTNRFYQSSYIPYHIRRQKQDETTTTTVTTPSSLTTLVNKSSPKFEPPKRDEEAESQRRARARRARESRRSTQGVTKEDVERAEEALAASDKDEQRWSRTAPPTDKEENKSDKENKPEEIPSYRRSWEERKEERLKAQNLNKDDPGPPTLRISRISGSNDSTMMGQGSSFRDQQKTGDKDEEPEKCKFLDPDQDPRISQAIQARRKRKERRPTGKVDPSDLPSTEGEKDKETKNDGKDSEDKSSEKGSRYNTLSASLDHSHDRPSSPYSRSSTTASVLPSDKDSDYKKLYEDEKVECERLRNDIRRLQQESVDNKTKADELKKEKRALERKLSEKEEEIKNLQEFIQQLRSRRRRRQNVDSVPQVDTQMTETMKSEISRLKEENAALIRVISKLSK